LLTTDRNFFDHFFEISFFRFHIYKMCDLETVESVSVTQWLLYRHICSSEVFVNFDKEGVLYSPDPMGMIYVD
jgi:hypothetical protein